MDWNISREFMWEIPFIYKVGMYLFFLTGLGFMIKGFYDKYKIVVGDKTHKNFKEKDGLLEDGLNWQNFFKTILLTGKVIRSSSVGFFHSFIFYGFVILVVATGLAMIQIDTPFNVFRGPIYVVISFASDIAGLVIMGGVIWAFVRRYIFKPEKLSATKPLQEITMYVMIILLMVTGYIVEGLRIYGTAAMDVETRISPIGWWIAKMFADAQVSTATVAQIYSEIWLVHLLLTMLFVGMVGYTKFSHIIMVPLSALITPFRRGAVLRPMNFENEDAETFGLGKISELTMKQKFDTLACVECGRCTEACPAKKADKILDPKHIVTKLRDFISDRIKKGEKDGDFWQEAAPLYESNELDACTTCGACMEECPSNIEHVNIILNLKRYKALTLGDLQPDAATAAQNVQVNSNPWGIAEADRFKWAEGHDIPVIEAGKKVDYLFYIGCAGSYDDASKKVVIDTIKLLKKANVSFAVLGNNEKCCGDPVRRFGDEYTFTEIVMGNIETFNQFQFDKIVTICPHCMHTIGKEYAHFEDGKYDVIHHSEVIAQLIKDGKLKAEKELKEEMTYHDPCYLGRHHGQYSAPREILNAIPGIKVNEMNTTKDCALCCGMGGGNMWYELPEGKHLALNRLQDIADTKMPKVAISCPYCMINFDSSRSGATENLQIQDVATIFSNSLN